MKILVLNGPNLNLLGEREPLVYGKATLADVEKICHERAAELGAEIDFRQTNDEAELIEWLHQARNVAGGVVINPAALSHYSFTLRDAVAACGVPVVEVHISNIYAREEFRQRSVVSPVARGVISGFGVEGYALAVDAVARILAEGQ
ncbi:MAG: type II 3-dehydroquinate dehydratase [Actinomycetota bacterium]|nr:type II 3-dehydroquinate dehydratase [Actinomycetota bacterium]